MFVRMSVVPKPGALMRQQNEKVWSCVVT